MCSVIAMIMTGRELLAAGFPILSSICFSGSSLSGFVLAATRFAISAPALYFIAKWLKQDLTLKPGMKKQYFWLGTVLLPIIMYVSIILIRQSSSSYLDDDENDDLDDVIFRYLYLYGIYYTTSLNVSLVNAAQPVITALCMLSAGKEKATGIKSLSILCSVLGCFVLVLADDDRDKRSYNPHQNMLLGNILLFTCNTLWAVYLIYQVPLLQDSNPTAVSFWTALYSLPTTVIVCIIEYIIVGDSVFDALVGENYVLVWVTIVYYGIVTSCITQIITLLCIRHTNPTVVCAFVPIQPLVTIIVAIFLLSDYPNTGQYAAAVLIVLGLWGVLYSRTLETKRKAQLLSASPAPTLVPASDATQSNAVELETRQFQETPPNKKEDPNVLVTDVLKRNENNDPIALLMSDLSVKDGDATSKPPSAI